MKGGWVALMILSVVLIAGIASFVVSPADNPDPVPFEDTVTVGLTLEDRHMLQDEQRLVPRAQVQYSQYPYIVGYRGMGLLAETIDDPVIRQQFGYPQVVYVEVADESAHIDDEGYLAGHASNTWIPADEAVYVRDSGAQIPGAAATIPFENQTAAERFIADYGGDVSTWDDRHGFADPPDGADAAQSRIETQSQTADTTVTDRQAALDRPVSVTVGEDAETIQEAIQLAESDSTIVVPPGVYTETVTVNTSVTIQATDAELRGDETGTVLTIAAPDVAVTGLEITGVGDDARATGVNHGDDWDAHTEAAYGHADAGITIDAADRIYLHDVSIETPTAGIVLRDSHDTVIEGVTVQGAEHWFDGFMGISAIRSPAIIQDSTFSDGRDGVYSHRSDELVVRNSTFQGGRFGIHLMYTSDALLQGNDMAQQDLGGVTIMTSPSGTVIADNQIADASQGILTSGSNSYIARNVVVDSTEGISTNARNSIYTENVVLGNTIGFRAASIIPDSAVYHNDFVDNTHHVQVGVGPLRVWSGASGGNYWHGAVDDRPYTANGPIDSRLHRMPAATVLAASPVATAMRELLTMTPGMRSETVVDTDPRATPANPDRIDTAIARSEHYDEDIHE